MSVALKIRDETTTGEVTKEFELIFLAQEITVRELIKKRVYEEIDNYHKNAPDVFRGLIQPNESEQALNGFKLKSKKKIDRDKQFQKAIEAFESHALLVIVDDQQVDDLEQTFRIMPNTQVSFLKLVPLVGG